MPLYETAEDLANENRVKLEIERHFEIKLKKLYKTHVMDFKGSDGFYYEVKTRTNAHDTYDSTMVGYNKIEFINNSSQLCLFFFAFTDGIYFYQYDKDKLPELEIKMGWRRDGKSKPKLHAYIPIKYLKKLGDCKPPSAIPIQVWTPERFKINIPSDKIEIGEEIDNHLIKNDAIDLLYSI